MSGLMDELNKAVSKVQEGAKDLLDKTQIDEKIVGAAKDLKDKTQEFLDKTDIDDKITGVARDLKARAQETFEKARVQETFDKAAAGAKSLFEQSLEKVQPSKPKDAMEQIQDEVDQQVKDIRTAATASDPIHDFFQQKYNSDDAPKEEAPEA